MNKAFTKRMILLALLIWGWHAASKSPAIRAAYVRWTTPHAQPWGDGMQPEFEAGKKALTDLRQHETEWEDVFKK